MWEFIEIMPLKKEMIAAAQVFQWSSIHIIWLIQKKRIVQLGHVHARERISFRLSPDLRAITHTYEMFVCVCVSPDSQGVVHDNVMQCATI